MAKKRKTAADRQEQRTRMEQREWDTFQRTLDAAKTFDDSAALLKTTPPEDAPGRRYYSAFAFFVNEIVRLVRDQKATRGPSFIVPGGASHDEKLLYLQLIRRFGSNGQLEASKAKEIEEALRQSMEE